MRSFQIKKGDKVEGKIRGKKEGERYFEMIKVNKINFEDKEKISKKVKLENMKKI